MTKRNVVMASAPTSSAARSQAWISTVRFTLNHNISAPELGRSAAVQADTRLRRDRPSRIGAVAGYREVVNDAASE
jgi:hypothetical protein